MIDYSIIGQRIRNARREAALTQEELAEKIKTSTNYLSRIENGRVRPNLEMLDKISSNVNVSLSFLFDGVALESGAYLQKDLADVLEACRPEKKKLIYDIALRISQYE